MLLKKMEVYGDLDTILILLWGLSDHTLLNQPWKKITLSGKVKKAVSFYRTSFLIKYDKTLWSTGYNESNQAGTNYSVTTSGKKCVDGWIKVASDVIDVVPNAHTTFILKSNGNLWGIGQNEAGNLGIGSKNNKDIWIYSLNNVIKVAVGTHSTIALKKDGTVWAVGSDVYGQLGFNASSYDETCTGITNFRDGPCNFSWKKVDLLSDIISVVGSNYHNIALKSDGSVWVTGMSDLGQLGLSTDLMTTCIDHNSVNHPCIKKWTKVAVLKNIVAIYSGRYSSMAVESDGSIWVTGYNASRMLGLDFYGNPTCNGTDASADCYKTWKKLDSIKL